MSVDDAAVAIRNPVTFLVLFEPDKQGRSTSHFWSIVLDLDSQFTELDLCDTVNCRKKIYSTWVQTIQASILEEKKLVRRGYERPPRFIVEQRRLCQRGYDRIPRLTEKKILKTSCHRARTTCAKRRSHSARIVLTFTSKRRS